MNVFASLLICAVICVHYVHSQNNNVPPAAQQNNAGSNNNRGANRDPNNQQFSYSQGIRPYSYGYNTGNEPTLYILAEAAVVFEMQFGMQRRSRKTSSGNAMQIRLT